jgi:hypothetical protein
MNEKLNYEVPTATQNIGDNYIEDFELMATQELSSYADGSDYQSIEFSDTKGSIKYDELGDVSGLIALDDDNFYGANGRRNTRSRSRKGNARSSGRSNARRGSLGGFLGGVGEEIKLGREARRERRLARVEGRQARKMTEAQAQVETARAMGKGTEAELEIAKTLGATAQAQQKKGLSTGAIIGITIGALAVIGVIAYFVIKKKKAGSLATPVLKPAV